jgi:hypothetical protein
MTVTAAHSKSSRSSLVVFWQRILTLSSAYVLTISLLQLTPRLVAISHSLHRLTAVKVKVKVMLRSTVSRSACLDVKHPSRVQDHFFSTVTAANLLMRGLLSDEVRVCRLQLLLVLTSAVILGSESRRTHDRTLLFQIRDATKLKVQVLVLISPRNWVSQLYLQAPGTQSQGQSQCQSCFTTGGLPPISSSWRQALWVPRPGILFSTEPLR